MSGIVVNGNYINGVDKAKGWYPKLIAAGCEETKTGNLRVPKGKEAIGLMTELFGAEKVAKYVSLGDAAPEKQSKPSAVAKKEYPQVTVNITDGAGYIKGIERGSALEKRLFDAGAGFVAKTGDIKIPENSDAKEFMSKSFGKNVDKVVFNDMRKNAAAAHHKPEVAVEKKAEPEKKASAFVFTIAEKADKIYVNNIKNDDFRTKLLAAGCKPVGKFGSLEFPESQKSISKFLNATLTKEAIVAEGGYEIKKEDSTASTSNDKKKDSGVLEKFLKSHPDVTPEDIAKELANLTSRANKASQHQSVS
ncbi:MAG: hypothetical protein PHO62_07965 [Sulfurimonas sp.]|uniref:hypothetical protein n=1 Tax=Sulfurimonas sp. TaxID=2022749 RepID=UPI00263329C5|nr:hypothetical protein [Sulfurimonas sp.]MDD5373343.1 hypothetical protein [Sulfurimonas sp.]